MTSSPPGRSCLWGKPSSSKRTTHPDSSHTIREASPILDSLWTFFESLALLSLVRKVPKALRRPLLSQACSHPGLGGYGRGWYGHLEGH
jgi:hypothetical protein